MLRSLWGRAARAGTATAAVAVVFGLAGCGGDQVAEELAERQMEEALGTAGGDVEIDIDEDEGSITVEGEDGDTSISFGGSDLPEGFPESLLPDDVTIESSSSMEQPDGSFLAVYFTSGDGLDEMYDWYLGALADEGLDVVQQLKFDSDGIPGFTIFGSADGREVSVTGSEQDGANSYSVTVIDTP